MICHKKATSPHRWLDHKLSSTALLNDDHGDLTDHSLGREMGAKHDVVASDSPELATTSHVLRFT